jgi:endogenous inhibitor of DNA gyrase (YacG/DUF329 family)
MVFNCPICGVKVERNTAEPAGKTAAFFPFCSQRCKMADLNAWLESQYIISDPFKEHENNLPQQGESTADNPDNPENMLK